jgi:hypothetical protein
VGGRSGRTDLKPSSKLRPSMHKLHYSLNYTTDPDTSPPPSPTGVAGESGFGSGRGARWSSQELRRKGEKRKGGNDLYCICRHTLFARQIWAGWIAATIELVTEMFFVSISLLRLGIFLRHLSLDEEE